MAKQIRGLEEKHEQQTHKLLRDTRTLSQKLLDFIHNPLYVGFTIGILAVIGFLYSFFIELVFLASVGLFFSCHRTSKGLPFRMPETSNEEDPNDPKPGTTQLQLARGITFFGNDRANNQELWFNNEDMRTHCLIFGSTGSGKTEALISISFNSLVQGSGFIYVDGKGDNSLYTKIFSITRSMGREDDLLLINFMTGAKDIVGAQSRRLSNTMNPFAIGSSGMLSQLVVSMMDSGGSSSDGDMWKGRAISFVEALLKILVYMRDRGDLLLDAHVIRTYFVLPKLESIVCDALFPMPDGRMTSIAECPELVLQPLNGFLDTLPGFDKSKKGKQSNETFEQFGFITMQLTRQFSSLADTYGHIVRTKLAEVDFRDVVLNRRILVVLLPALEKAPDELANLGKIIVSSLKAMMASGLGEHVEGTYQEIIERKPTNAPSPFVCILDEYGYYAVEGFAVVPAQARSLGFSTIFAGQDLPAFQKASKEEALSIGANTNIKLCMKLEDPSETWEFFQKTAGEAWVTHTSGFNTNTGSINSSYNDSQNAQTEKRARIDLLDLKDQREGEAHIFFKSTIIRAKMFFANPKAPPRIKINQFLKVDSPTDEYFDKFDERMETFKQYFDPQRSLPEVSPIHENILKILNVRRRMAKTPPAQAYFETITRLIRFEDEKERKEAVNFDAGLIALPKGKMSLLHQDTSPLSELDPNEFFKVSYLQYPLANFNDMRKNIELIERFAGTPVKTIRETGENMILSVSKASSYPQMEGTFISRNEVMQSLQQLITALKEKRKEN